MNNEVTKTTEKKPSIFNRKFHWNSKTMMFGYAIIIASFALNFFNIEIGPLVEEISNISWDNIKVGITTFFFLILRTVTEKPLEGNGWIDLLKWAIDKLLGRKSPQE